MVKRKKRTKTQRSARRPPEKLMREIAAAMELYEEGETETTRQMLLQLAQRYPRSKLALMTLLEVCQEMNDWHTFLYYSEQLLELEYDDERVETLNNLTFAALQLGYPALAWQYANQIVAKNLDFKAIKEVKDYVAKSVPLLLQEFEDSTGLIGLSDQEKLDYMALHDRMRFFTESGHPEDAVQVADILLENEPDSISVLNNLSFCQFLMGDVEEAKTTAYKALNLDQDNFHALGNLVRYHFLTAEFEEAQAFAARLQQTNSDLPDFEMKQAEAFAFLGNDELVWATYERAREKVGELYPLHLHLSAVASYRLGDEKTAWKLWLQAVKQQPSFEIAQECLAEKWLPVGEREIPWYWPFRYWVPQNFGNLLEKHFGENMKRVGGRSLARGMESMLADRPYLSRLIPHMLERGDLQTREFALFFIYMIETPELLQFCHDFALSQYGSDELRMDAMQFISQNHPEMLPRDKQVTMWVSGEQRKLFMMGFEITDEPLRTGVYPRVVLDKHEKAYELLLNDDPESAELLLHEIIAEAPDFPSAYNHLALAYLKQGQEVKARELVKETFTRFPDYFFARVAMARMMAEEKRIAEARDIVEPLMRLSKLHYSEFRALAIVQMEIALADKQTEEARSWLNMWQEFEPDNPQVQEWKVRIGGPGFLEGLQNLLGRSRDRSP